MFEIIGMIVLAGIACWFAVAGLAIIWVSLVFDDRNRTGAVVGLFFIGGAFVIAHTLATHISITIT